jgi:hypothetical protein
MLVPAHMLDDALKTLGDEFGLVPTEVAF